MSAADSTATKPHNLTGVDFHDVPARKVAVSGGIIDAHNHVGDAKLSAPMIDAAAAYGVSSFYTMTQLENVAGLREMYPGKFHFIAVPAWQTKVIDAAFFADWKRRLEAFRELGAGLFKLHAAPGTMRRWGISLDDPRIREIADFAYALGYNFMTHVGDPKAWFFDKGPYADGSFGTFASQFDQLERMLDRYPDRLHLGAHMGGSLEELDRLGRRLEKYPRYILDTSATKWMTRAVAEQSLSAVRDFFITFQDRIVFGSDVVVNEKYDWEHYASRYWVLQHLWESEGAETSGGLSPIADPDASRGFDPRSEAFTPPATGTSGAPKLLGVNLPVEVLRKIYRDNAVRLLPR